MAVSSLRMRAVTVLSWSLALGSALVAIAALAFAVLNGAQARVVTLPNETSSLVLGIGAPMLGLMVVRHRPRQAVGWLLVAIGVFAAANALTGELSAYSLLVRPHALPGGVFASWVETWTWVPAFGLAIVVLPLVFPDGNLLSRRWRAAVYAGLAGLTALLSVFAVGAWGSRGVELLTSSAPAAGPSGGLLGVVLLLGLLLTLSAGAAAVASLVLRLRHSAGQQRQQVKWFLYGAFLLLASSIVSWLFAALTAPLDLLGSGALLAGLAMAVFRYRLYDIDRIISRTVGYVCVTALLVATYVALVTVVTRFTPTGNSLAVAASTLAVAGLFQPLRRRVQQVIDRRFNRSRYDADRTVESFSHRLRSEVNLEAVRTGLLAVVGQTLEPSRATLWLRVPERGR